MNDRSQAGFIAKVFVAAIAVTSIVLIFGAWWMGRSAQQATEDAVQSVSMFFLDELAGRREQVVETNLKTSIKNMEAAVGTLTDEDLSDIEHLQAFQARMKKLYGLEKFAFVDENGLIYTSLGTQENIDEYDFDYQSISGPEISVKTLSNGDKKVIIAEPLDSISLMGHSLVACFMEKDMQEMIEGLSLQTDKNSATFCNLYTSDGTPLTSMVLGGLASEDNLLEALRTAEFDEGYSLNKVVSDFQEGQSGLASFTYHGIYETLDYEPVPGTDWMVTYLVRESVISDQVSSISEGITARSLVQTLVTVFVLLLASAIMIGQVRRSARLAVEKEAIETETRVKQEEMERQLSLQEQLLEQERQRAQQDKMITALASDYRSVYYVDLDDDEGICYQTNGTLPGAPKVGERFSFRSTFTTYAQKFVAEKYRDDFLASIEADSIREALSDQTVISRRYLVEHNGIESYEMMRVAGVRHVKDREDGIVHAVGLGFADVDNETREQMAQSLALSDALAVAENASRAKTAFLSSMSHEIRTPMNAIIGMDKIALADPDIPEKTRDQLEKIGDSAQHLLALINDILDVSRIEAGRLTLNNEAFSMSKLIAQVNAIISSQCGDKGIKYNCKIDERVESSYIGDDVKLRQTLVNVLGNAVKFTPENGSIDFIIERTAQFASKSTLRFIVRDTGVGIDEEFLPHIFETFSREGNATTNQYGSTGLGLAIAKNIVEMMDGTIEVASKKNEGTTFTITITLAVAEYSADRSDMSLDPQKEEELHDTLAGCRLLLAEDVDINAEIMIELMDMEDVVVERAQNGKEAVEMFNSQEPNYYNAIFMDIHMPVMNGLEAAKAIRALARTDAREIPIIALTANAFDEDVRKSLQAGMNAHLSKPIEPDTLLSTLASLIQKGDA